MMVVGRLLSELNMSHWEAHHALATQANLRVH